VNPKISQEQNNRLFKRWID